MNKAKDIQELLKPRYKVIATFPKCHWSVGKILEQDSEGWFEVILDWRVELEYIDAFPHLFKPLAWYEEREASEMPEYVKFRDVVMKVAKWEFEPDYYMPICWLDEKYNRSNDWYPDTYDFQPATEAEYQNYINQKK